MLTKKKLSHIKTLQDLKTAQLQATADLKAAEQAVEQTLNKWPVKILGSAAGMVAGAIIHKIQPQPETAETVPLSAASAETDPADGASFAKTLQSVGTETAYFALAKLAEKILSGRS